ncbi:hypothetical protein [Streptomyces formicae]|uniref:Uncharacterized protein n=1 Tax=Streptomyces formicae TaxID=1616117 RepID=A0A291QDY1_9ACTN|nr:hypothetical protein [Streptomyces formicae]ATL30020.1 hypothetical protein KY5_5002c [Streptomyces formicae]
MHIHAYLWTGPRAHFDEDALRRPPYPDPPPPPAGEDDKDGLRLAARYRQVVAEFPVTGLPPIETAHWLMKPSKLIRGTWKEPKLAAEWLALQLAEYAPRFASEQDRDTTRLAVHVAAAADRLGWGGDVSLGHYLNGQSYLSLALVTCTPNNAAPGALCPEQR